MSIVSVLECVPNRVLALTRLVAAEGPLSRSDLQSRMVPHGDSSTFGNLVRETVRLQLVEEETTVRLHPSIKVRDVSQGGWFINFTDHAIMSASDESGNVSVKFALAWLLTCRPGLDIGWTDDQKPRMHDELDGENYDITNSSRFAMLAYWSRFLGYAVGMELGKRLVVPDPTEAIRRRIPSVFEKEAELSSGRFFARLGDLCPVLESGVVRSAVEAKLKRRRADNEISPATSAALLRLHAEGEIELVHKADADVHLLDLMYGDPRRVSHLRRVNKKKRAQ